jgi:hypothetical protein
MRTGALSKIKRSFLHGRELPDRPIKLPGLIDDGIYLT